MEPDLLDRRGAGPVEVELAMGGVGRPAGVGEEGAQDVVAGVHPGHRPVEAVGGQRVHGGLQQSRAVALGAHLVGIASAAKLNAFPPDPRWPQTPERISPYCKSVIVIASRIPVGAFRCKSNVPVQYLDMLVMRRMDKISYLLAQELEAAGHPSFVTAAQETDWSYKRASYGRLSMRHLGVEAEGLPLDVGEHHPGALPHEGQGAGHEGERGHDDGLARLEAPRMP